MSKTVSETVLEPFRSSADSVLSKCNNHENNKRGVCSDSFALKRRHGNGSRPVFELDLEKRKPPHRQQGNTAVDCVTTESIERSSSK